MSFDVLQDKIRAMKNPTVAGLDARIDYVPEHIRQAAFAEMCIRDSNRSGSPAPSPGAGTTGSRPPPASRPSATRTGGPVWR